MKLKRLLKKYNKLCKKASTIHREIMFQYEQAYVLNDIAVCKQIMNSLYRQNTTSIYEDTDSLKDCKFYKDLIEPR